MITKKQIKSLSECDGMLTILEKAVEVHQLMPVWLYEATQEASALRKARGYEETKP